MGWGEWPVLCLCLSCCIEEEAAVLNHDLLCILCRKQEGLDRVSGAEARDFFVEVGSSMQCLGSARDGVPVP